MNKKLLLIIGGLLLLVGLIKPNFSIPVIKPVSNSVVETHVTDAPSDPALLEKAKDVIDVLKQNNDSISKTNFLKLSSLYADLATLIELDGSDLVVKDTAAIREANSLCGQMLRLNIKDKYPNLASAAQAVIVTSIGDDDVLLNPTLRKQAASAFRALSWAFYEGSK